MLAIVGLRVHGRTDAVTKSSDPQTPDVFALVGRDHPLVARRLGTLLRRMCTDKDHAPWNDCELIRSRPRAPSARPGRAYPPRRTEESSQAARRQRSESGESSPGCAYSLTIPRKRSPRRPIGDPVRRLKTVHCRLPSTEWSRQAISPGQPTLDAVLTPESRHLEH